MHNTITRVSGATSPVLMCNALPKKEKKVYGSEGKGKHPQSQMTAIYVKIDTKATKMLARSQDISPQTKLIISA